ncbi:flagellin [Rhodohalobacter sp. 8-1]|uniref:flagellin n=1 Tax=Rhodohalobacter sp. 8-1 TaxID=3131972 RepID=UPI0030EB89DE
MASFGDLNRVNTNIQSLDSQLSLNRINRDLSDNQLKLSTGLRINKAEDDAAGYAIATKLNSRVAGLEQAMSNVGDAKSVLDIAESSFDTVMDNLIEMKSLSTQAANDTLGAEERGYIGDQISKLAEDINDIADQTVFQDTQLLNGADGGYSGSVDLTFQVGERASDTLEASIDAVNVSELFDGAGTGSISVSTAGAGALSFADGATQASAADYRGFLEGIDGAIESMNGRVNEIGMTQSSLSIREVTLSQSISANSSASSRIMDADFAKEQSESVRLQILQQTATSALAQANNGPQSVLGFLG